MFDKNMSIIQYKFRRNIYINKNYLLYRTYAAKIYIIWITETSVLQYIYNKISYMYYRNQFYSLYETKNIYYTVKLQQNHIYKTGFIHKAYLEYTAFAQQET